MSCRDAGAWRALLEHRFAAGAAEPAEWPRAAAHLADCGACRRLALAIDPSLLFQNLPAPAAAPGASDVEAMRQAVAGLRRARSLGASPLAAPARRRFGARGAITFLRAAAAAALVLALGAQLPAVRRGASPAVPALAGAALDVVAASADRGRAGSESLGVSGDVGRPSARVYQIAYRDMAVVMVVDKSLDL